jgi:hypothetical protein
LNPSWTRQNVGKGLGLSGPVTITVNPDLPKPVVVSLDE